MVAFFVFNFSYGQYLIFGQVIMIVEIFIPQGKTDKSVKHCSRAPASESVCGMKWDVGNIYNYGNFREFLMRLMGKTEIVFPLELMGVWHPEKR